MPVRSALAVLTRPAGRNEALASALQEQGVATLSLPALTVSLRPQAMQPWVAPDAYDLVIFVSGFAVKCYLQAWQQAEAERQWPPQTRAATVGAASALPLFEAGWIPKAQILHPEPDVPQDSESLWQILQEHAGISPRVLIVGAQEGRNWLRQRLEAEGSQVDRYAVYERVSAHWTAPQLAPLAEALERGHAISALLTSSQGVDAFASNLQTHGLTKLYARAGFVAIHERVASRLQWQAQRAGCGELNVELCMPDDAAILAAVLQSLKH